MQTKNSQGLKINKMLSTQQRATEVNNTEASNQNCSKLSSIEMPSKSPGDNVDILNEIRNTHREKLDKTQKMENDVVTIKDDLDSLRADVVSLGSRISEAKKVSQLEDESARLVNTTKNMNSKLAWLEACVKNQENYSRRNNIRIRVPEET